MQDLLNIYGDPSYLNMTRPELEARNVPEELIATAEAKQVAIHQKRAIRSEISHAVGDDKSLLGTVSDGAVLTLHHLAKLATALSEAQSLAEVREAAAPFAALTTGFLSAIEADEVRLPTLYKGEGNVLDEIKSRSTSVTDVLTLSSAP